MFRATVKIAYGFFTTSKNLDVNLSTREVIDELQMLIKNNFNVEEDAVIQIVKSGVSNAELGPELSENALLRIENEIFFYARIIRRFNNIEYLKIDIDNYGIQRACYLKKEDLERRRQRRYLAESDILPASREVQEDVQADSLCVICSENEVYHERRFSCEHLFCSNCHSQWLISCSHYNCPLCRS